MKLLITGGAGFIGTNFIHYWLQNHPEDTIVNFDALTYAGNLENHKQSENHHNYHFVKGDICDYNLVSDTLHQHEIDTIVHFAAESHVDRSLLGPMTFVQTNVTGTVTLLEAARAIGNIRFHHVSTDEVFGMLQKDDTHKFNEQTSYSPNSPYSASKASSDLFVNAYYKSFGIPVTITNCSNNYGPYMFPEKLLPLAITNLPEGKKVPIYGKGDQVRDWLHVSDHVLAIELILQKGTIGQTYCVGSMDKEITNLEVIQILCNILNKDFESSVEFVKDRPGHDFKYAVDSTKINTQLGWRPQTTLQTGLTEMVAWYQANQSWWQSIKSGEYQDYYQKQYKDRT
jgi:dTDP-glucose 4,6-dehydratase